MIVILPLSLVLLLYGSRLMISLANQALTVYLTTIIGFTLYRMSWSIPYAFGLAAGIGVLAMAMGHRLFRTGKSPPYAVARRSALSRPQRLRDLSSRVHSQDWW